MYTKKYKIMSFSGITIKRENNLWLTKFITCVSDWEQLLISEVVPVQLSDGPLFGGRLEVFYNGSGTTNTFWGVTCYDSSMESSLLNAASVACKQMGFYTSYDIFNATEIIGNSFTLPPHFLQSITVRRLLTIFQDSFFFFFLT